jgi:hypothetical protein
MPLVSASPRSPCRLREGRQAGRGQPGDAPRNNQPSASPGAGGGMQLRKLGSLSYTTGQTEPRDQRACSTPPQLRGARGNATAEAGAALGGEVGSAARASREEMCSA